MGSIQRTYFAGLFLAFSGLGVEVHAQCTAQAGPPTQTTCAGVALALSGSGTGVAPLSYVWSGSPYLSPTNTAATTFTYPAPVATAQSVNVVLTVTDANGCVNTDNVVVTVNPTPSALLTSTGPALISTFNGITTFSICDPAASWPFSFQDQSGPFTGSVRTISWGDGSPTVNPAAGWSLNHTYAQGLYTLTYGITYPNGCSSTRTYTVFLGTNPGGGISTDPNTTICTGGTLPFYLNSVLGNTPGTTYLIDFGDGQDTLLNHPPPASISHTYNISSCTVAGGSYTVYFTAQNPCDATNGQISPVRVSETPSAQFLITPNDTACVNSTVTFTDQSLGAQAPACLSPKRVWSISPAAGWVVTAGPLGSVNSNPANPTLWTNGATNLSVQFTVPGTYTITDLTGNSCGISSLDRTVCIESPPTSNFTISPTTGCAPLTSSTVNLSTSPNSCSTRYVWSVTSIAGPCGAGPAWNFAGGTGTNSFQPQFQFTQAGNYTVRLQVINACGTFLHTEAVTVNAPPEVDVANLTGICATQCVNPTAVVQACGAAISTYAWTFPGGSPANSNVAVPPQICYASATSSSISLTVTNACGSATDVITLAVGSVPGTPVIASNSPVCAGQNLSISAAPIPGTTMSWTGPNGFASNQASVTIMNANATHAGVYTVVAVSNGCAGPAATVNVQVIAAPTISVTPTSAAICNGQNASFTASGAGNYQWFIGATQVGTGALFNTSPAVSTIYTVSGNLGGCPGSTTVPVTVYPVTNVNAGADQTFCDQPIPVQLNSFPQPGLWSGPNVSAGGMFTPVPDQLGPVVLTYTHIDGNGCTNSDNVTITVQDLVLIANAGADTFFCQGNTPVTLPATPPGGTWIGAGPGGQFTPATVGPFTATYSFGTGTCATSDAVDIQVLPAPTITVPPNFARCANAAPVPLAGTPAGGVWSGPGVSGPPYAFDPAVAGPGAHVINFTYTDASGCSSSAPVNATVNALPTVNAGPDIQLCDQPIAFQLTASPVGGTWSATTMAVTPGGSITPSGVGSDVLTYTYSDAIGCMGSDQITVDVVPIAQPAFAGNDTSVCVNSGAFQLSGLPAGGTWSGPIVAANGLFNPTLAGSYALTYSFGAQTCFIQDQVTVVVNALPVVDAGDVISLCMDAGIQVLTAMPAGGVWSGAGVDPAGNFDPTLAFPGGNPMTYTFTDPVTGCVNSDLTLVTVNPLPTAAMLHDPLACTNVAFPFTNNSTGATSYAWDFGDLGTSLAASPSHNYTATGIYPVRLIATNAAGCKDTVYSSVEVWAVPLADLSLSADSGCGPLMVDFSNNSSGSGLSYAWDFDGMGTSTDQYPTAIAFLSDPEDGITYNVSLTVSNVCGSAVDQAPVTVIPPPTAVFGPNLSEYCSFQEVPFANASIGMPDSFQWDFGDGTGSTDPGPIVTNVYVADVDPLNITVTLIASNQCGTDTATQNITIQPNQVTAFFNTTPVNGCSPLVVDLTQFSSGDTTWFWDLGDGNTSLAHDLTHTFTEPGTYTIELFAYGCGFDSFTTEVTVYPSPELAFTVSPSVVCVGEPFTFTSQTSAPVGLNWDFGDLSGSTLSALTHTYASSGTYDVSLTATSPLNGCTTTVTQQVVVSATPVAAFTATPANGCIDLAVAFTNSSTTNNFNQWDLGDGNTSVLIEPFHTYTTAGTYTVRLITESLNGCTDTATAVVMAYPLPVSAFTLSANSGCGPTSSVQTINASQGAIGFTWDLGNGTTSALNQPLITYDTPGTYEITLTATNQYGCTSVSSSTFIQHPTPEAAFTASPQPGCQGYPIAFDNTSINATAFAWTFGDGLTSTATTPLHSYEDAGTYSVQLIAFGSGGCSDTLSVTDAVLIHPRPYAAYTSDTLASLAHALQFSNESEGALSYLWDFDDGEQSIAIHPLHVFPADGGGYTVCLVAVNEFGCPDTLCKFVDVPGEPNIFVPNAFTPNGDGRNETFHPVLNGFIGWNYRFLIFDRWGLPIYDTNVRSDAWDGLKNGQDAPVDVYVWKVIVERDGDARNFVGHVTLVR